MDPIPQVLIIGPLDFLLRERAIALAQAGFTVTHTQRASAKKVLRHSHQDLVLIGHTISGVGRKALVEWIRKEYPSTRVMDLHIGRAKGLRAANTALSVHCPADDVVQAARTLLGFPTEPRTVNRLLLIGAAESVIRSRVSLLERAGYSVCKAVALNEIEAAYPHGDFDLVVIGADCGPVLKTVIASKLRLRQSRAPILELGRETPDLAGAHCVSEYSDEQLLFAVRACLGGSIGLQIADPTQGVRSFLR